MRYVDTRICPGRHFAEASLFLAISSILHVFDVTLDPEFTGKDVEMTTGLVSYVQVQFCVGLPLFLTSLLEYLRRCRAF